jgi:hypothetical protein
LTIVYYHPLPLVSPPLLPVHFFVRVSNIQQFQHKIAEYKGFYYQTLEANENSQLSAPSWSLSSGLVELLSLTASRSARLSLLSQVDKQKNVESLLTEMIELGEFMGKQGEIQWLGAWNLEFDWSQSQGSQDEQINKPRMEKEYWKLWKLVQKANNQSKSEIPMTFRLFDGTCRLLTVGKLDENGNEIP